jgi:signal transduction histidine kinase
MEARRSSEPEVYARMGPMLDELLSTLRRVEALADFEEHACHFDPMGVRLRAWLNDHQVRFSKEFGPVELRTDFSSCGDDVIIYATTFWLDLVFTNLMKNSLEATGFPCRILVRAIADPKRVRLVIIDNGLGLASEDQNRAFTVQYSSKGTDRGRGHMEIGDAMRRMGGGARVDMVPDHGYRVHLTFRREVM